MAGLPFLALLVVSAMWGSHPVVGKVVEGQLSPLSLTVWRFTLGAVCYLPFSKRFAEVFRLPRKVFWQLALAGLCWSVLYPLFYYQSLNRISPIESLLLVNTSPFLAALFAWAVLRERLAPREWLAILVSFAGVALLVTAQWTGRASLSGELFALVASAAFAVYTVASRSLFQRLPLLDVLLYTSVWGAVDAWLIALASGRVGEVAGSLTALSTAGWGQLAYIVIVVSTVAYVLYGYGLKRLPAAVSSALTFYPQVLFAAVVQWLWLGMVPGLTTVASGLCILLGTAIMKSRKQARDGTPQPDGPRSLSAPDEPRQL